MKNLIYQYYIPYEGNDKHLGGDKMPKWAINGQRSAQRYAEHCGADYLFIQDKYYPELDPRLESLRVHNDPQFEKYNKVLVLDLDMTVDTKENIFNLPMKDVAMVHENGIFQFQSRWLSSVMDVPLSKRGIIAYGKKLFGNDWMFPKSVLYPLEKYRYMNGGMQLWSRQGRQKAREHFTSVHDYVLHTRYTEQMYVNLQLSQPVFNVTELDTKWNRLSHHWQFGQPDGYINHYLGPRGKKMLGAMI